MIPEGVSYSLAQIAERLGGELRGDGSLCARGVNTLDEADAEQVTFITSEKYVRQWAASKAMAAIVSQSIDEAALAGDDRPVIRVPDAELASIEVLGMFLPPTPMPEVGVHSAAWVHPEAIVESMARIGPQVSVDRGAVIEDGAVLHAGVRIYAEVRIGQGTILHSNTVIRERCVIGRGVILHQNVSIGADGFGYRPAPDGSGLLKMPHLGHVIIEDGVEIGAGSCVDRGKYGPTIIGAGTKIDNLVQIGHNCRIGRCCVIAGLVGISGSVEIGDGAQIAGGAGIADHCTLGDQVKLGARTLVLKDVDAGETLLGIPADRADRVLRQWAGIRRLPELIKQLARQARQGD